MFEQIIWKAVRMLHMLWVIWKGETLIASRKYTSKEVKGIINPQLMDNMHVKFKIRRI